MVSIGCLNSSLIHPREIFKTAILSNSAGIILFHNHPSGDPEPSQEDINISTRIKEAGKIMGIELLDHIIIGSEGAFCSLKGKGLLIGRTNEEIKKSNAILFMEVNMNTNQENNGVNEKGTDLTVNINKEFIFRNIGLILSSLV